MWRGKAASWVTAWEESEPDSRPHVANSKAPASAARGRAGGEKRGWGVLLASG